MGHAMTAEELFIDLKEMPSEERSKFFILLANNAFRDDDLTHEQVFGHLKNDTFTANESAEYLEVSLPTFRRLVQAGKLKAVSELGRNQLFSTHDLKTFKRARQST
jgi:excisionase family DNA binding protein